jgi:uncharacterized protein YukE
MLTEMDHLGKGTGLFHDAAQTVSDVQQGGAASIAIDSVTDGLDLLNMVMDPLGELAAAGVGWVIEHVGFLNDALDELAGDPEAIKAQAKHRDGIASDLEAAAQEYDSKATSLAGTWTSAAGHAYQQTATNYADLLRGSAGASKDAATAMRVGGSLVGAERGMIRDLISQLVGELIRDALIALGLSVATCGGSVAAFIGDAVYRAGMLAKEIGGRIAKLGERLAELAKKLGHAGDDLATASHQAATSIETASGAFSREASDAATSAERAVPSSPPSVHAGPGSRAELQQSYGAFMQRGADRLHVGGAYSHIQQRLNPDLAGLEGPAPESTFNRAHDRIGTAKDRVEQGKSMYDALNPPPEEGQEQQGGTDGDAGTQN